MIPNKKALALETLARVILSVVILLAALKVGKVAADAIFGGSEAVNSLNKLAEEINSENFQLNTARRTFIFLDPGTALIGFNRNSQEFRCFNCNRFETDEEDENPSTQLETQSYYITRPSNLECNNKPCICLCRKNFKFGQQNPIRAEMTCGSFICKEISNNIDIYGTIVLRNPRQSDPNPYWENGFFFVRSKERDFTTPLNGVLPINTQKKTEISLEKKTVNGQDYFAACPSNTLSCF